MNDLLLWSGRLAGLAGVCLCLIAGIARVAGYYWIGSFQSGTVLQAGMALMIAACLSFLALLTGRGGTSH